MRARSPWCILGSLTLALGGILVAGYAGWLGPLATCGADGATVCIVWPGAASAATWAIFLGTLAGLAAWQARDWRGTSVERREIGWLGLVLAAALIERAWRVDLAQVEFDEASAASLVAAWHVQGLFPLTGIISSVGIPNPPAWPYLLALALLPIDSPYALVGLGIAVGLLSVVLTWWVGRRWLGPWGALAAAVFYAGGFWAAFLGRSGWQPAFLQVPVILCLDALLVLALRRWPWALVIACGWLALMAQLHYIALVFALMVPLAAFPARRALRPVHLVAAALTATTLLTPVLLYELNPSIRFRDLGPLLGDAGGPGAHWDLESALLSWTLVTNGGVAGLGGPDAEGLRLALGRWASLSFSAVPLVGFGLLAAVAGWPKGWRGWLIAAWVLIPIVGLARHTLGILFHYLYAGLPGMALVVGALVEFACLRMRRLARLAVASALAAYVAVSAAILWVVLDHVDRTGLYPGLGKPLGLNMAAADAARAVLQPGGEVLVGGRVFEVEILRFSLGYAIPSRVFDDCGAIPLEPSAVYLLNSEHTPAAEVLAAAGAPLLGRVPRADDAFLVYGPPRVPTVEPPKDESLACRERSA
ncbi:MAG TPA: hypothetical protein VKV73_23910 [Chloroflexota bacterium]|nr:hypothetical protein [Chloroflexota bacterium]